MIASRSVRRRPLPQDGLPGIVVVLPAEEVTMRAVAWLVPFCVAVALPALAQDKATIQKLNDQFTQAFNKGDIEAVAGMYTEDAVLLPPGSDMVKGRNDIRSFWKQTAEQIGDFKLTTVDVKPLGSDAAREIGTFSLRTKGQPPQDMSGKYVVVWQKVGGDWKLATDIWNDDK